jgi:putative oxidoreductase
MSDTSTVQSNSTSVQSSASAAPKIAPTATLSRGELLKKVLVQQTFGLLCMRLALGATMIAYGVPKFMGGAAYLTKIGSAMQVAGIHFGFEFWGLMAALVEVVGGIMLIIGAYYRVSCVLLAFVMAVAALSVRASLGENPSANDLIMNVLHPLSMCAIFLSVMFLGPGRLSVQKD